MSAFTYVALDKTGQRHSGTLSADSRAAALDEVIGRGLSPISVDQADQNGSRRRVAQSANVVGPTKRTRVSSSGVEAFTRELANLLAAGLPLSRALHLLRREVSNPTAKAILTQVHDDVVGGTSLADALAK